MRGNANILLVEGKDDLHVICNIFEHYKVPETFRVKENGGIEKVFSSLPVEIKGSGVEKIGIVIDADLDIEARWRQLRGILRNSGYLEIPEVPQKDGTLLQNSDLPLVGVWLMPDNILPGMLEDFITKLIPSDDDLVVHVKTALQGVPGDIRRYIVPHEPKAFIHTWLAWQEEPGSPLGLAITKRYLNPEVPEAASFVGWIRRLFG